MSENVGTSLTVYNPTVAQIEAINAILAKGKKNGMADMVDAAKRGGKKKAKAAREEEDDEAEYSEEDLEEADEEDEEEEAPAKKKKSKARDDDEEEEDETEEEDEESEDEDDEDGLDFSEVRAACNKYGEKHPKEMKAIYASFNVKNAKELEGLPKKWEPVYRKVKAKLAAKKKR